MSNSKVHVKPPEHLRCLKKHRKPIITAEGKEVALWEVVVPNEKSLLSEWAKAFREHYCLNSEIDSQRQGTGLSRKDFLFSTIFPDKSTAPGPSIRAGDFAEILVSDYVEYILGYWVPRGKFGEKATRNESVKGVDILGFFLPQPNSPSSTDKLIAFEAKAQFTGNSYSDRLQNAIDDSSQDVLRRAYTLHATKRRLRTAGMEDQALAVQRFQNISDHPYVFRSGAAAILTENAFDETKIINSTIVSSHTNMDNLELLIIRGKDLMDLVHALYERAADEA